MINESKSWNTTVLRPGVLGECGLCVLYWGGEAGRDFILHQPHLKAHVSVSSVIAHVEMKVL